MAFDRSKVLSAAQKHLAKGNYERAVAEYRKLVERDPKDLRTWLKIGDLYARIGKQREAVRAYERVARSYAEQGFHLKAVAVYKQILKLQPDRLDVLRGLAEAYEELQLSSDAMKAYERLAAAHAKAGRTDEMLEAMERMAELEPDDVAVRIKYAEALSRAGKREEAAEQFEEAGRLLLDEGREDDYLKVAERLLYHRPEDVELARDLARRYLERRDPKRALAKLQLCFKADPRHPGTLLALAEAFEQLRQVPKAVSVLRELGRLHREAGRSEEEAEVLERIVALAPQDAEARSRLEALRGREAAPEPEPEVVFDDETDVEIVEEDEVVLVEDVDSEEIAEIEAAAEAPPAPSGVEAEVARLMAECDVFARYGLHERIVEAMGRVVELVPDDIPARERLKDALLALGRTAEAVEQLHALAEVLGREKPSLARLYLRQVIELAPDDARAREALGLPPADAPSESGARPASTLGRSEAPVAQQEQAPAPDPAAPTGGEPTEAHEPSLPSEPPAVFETDSVEISEEEAARAEAEALQRTSIPPGDIEEALDEAEFFLAQGLLDEARATLEEALEAHPGHPLLLDRLRELAGEEEPPGSVPGSVPGSTPGSVPEDDEAFALAEKLAEELDEGTDAFLDMEEEDGELDVAADFERFKKEVEQTVGTEDVATHFDLGIAYKEMGLLDAAIDEFELCTRSAEREAAARAMLGLCYLERGDVSEAIGQFKKGLYAEQKTAEEELGLYYELGNAYEQLGDASEALYYFEKVMKREAGFRDVADRVGRLRGAGGAGEGVAVRSELEPGVDPFGRR